MRIVVDGLPVRGENSLNIVAQHLLEGWDALAADEVHLVVRAGAGLEAPDSVIVHDVRFGRIPFLSRLRAQSFLLPRLCRSLDADVLLGVIPATTVAPLRCPRAVIAWDLRYRLLPEQFSRRARLLRRVSYAIGFRQAKGVACISDRTRTDLLSLHPRLAKVPVRVARLGADHVDTWPVRPTESPYAIAFGHFPNKNVDLVLGAWKELLQHGGHEKVLELRVVGVPDSERAGVQERIETLGLKGVVTVQPWLAKESFQEQFASSRLVVFPSDFEGFGLPAVEAMRLGIPLVITPEPALLEVTAGHATVIEGQGPTALARAVAAALRTTPEALGSARQHAASFTWAHFAADVHTTLLEVTEPAPRRQRVRARAHVRLAGIFAAATLTLSGAAAAYALAVPSHSAPASHVVVTTTTGSGAAAPGTHAHAGSVSTHATSSTGAPRHSTGAAPGAPSSGPASSGRTNGSGGSLPPNINLPVPPTLPTVTTPSITVPTIPNVPPVTVPASACTTTTAVGTNVVTVPCQVLVP